MEAIKSLEVAIAGASVPVINVQFETGVGIAGSSVLFLARKREIRVVIYIVRPDIPCTACTLNPSQG